MGPRWVYPTRIHPSGKAMEEWLTQRLARVNFPLPYRPRLSFWTGLTALDAVTRLAQSCATSNKHSQPPSSDEG
ncbi:g9798 [Coccomyxa viridis]|uniref:G9798 protein n=1 Tax=Coccomyxa viridis TaxID=1274662 RepID=A0ABP1G3Z5_9CHLO